MNEPKLKNRVYVFLNTRVKAKIKFTCTSDTEAIMILSSMVNNMNEWSMKKYKN